MNNRIKYMIYGLGSKHSGVVVVNTNSNLAFHSFQIISNGSSTQDLEHPHALRDNRQVRGSQPGRVGRLRRRLPRHPPLRRRLGGAEGGPRFPIRIARNRGPEASERVPKRGRAARVLLARGRGRGSCARVSRNRPCGGDRRR